MQIKNFSRHPLNADQERLINEAFPGAEVSAPLSPFFASGEEFIAAVGGQTACVVVPAEILLDTLALGIPQGTRLIVWRVDKEARARGNFACRGMSVYTFSGGVTPEKTEISTVPTVETSFKSGVSVPYGGTETTPEELSVETWTSQNKQWGFSVGIPSGISPETRGAILNGPQVRFFRGNVVRMADSAYKIVSHPENWVALFEGPTDGASVVDPDWENPGDKLKSLEDRVHFCGLQGGRGVGLAEIQPGEVLRVEGYRGRTAKRWYVPEDGSPPQEATKEELILRGIYPPEA